MKKTCSILIGLLLCTVAAQAQLLWKISGNGLTQSSYVVGTNHLAPVSFTDSIVGVDEALNAVEQVYGELDISVIADPVKLMQMQTAMMLPEGLTIDSVLTPEQMTRLNAFMKSTLGADMNNPIVAAQLERYTPVALETQFTLLMYLKNHPGFNPQSTLDAYFQGTAAEQGKPTGGLETMEFQIGVLYESVPMERQVVRLMCLVDNKDYYEDATERLAAAYFSQDLAALKVVIDEKMNNACDATPEEDEALLYARNANWAKLLTAIVQEKSTLVAVGAAHLPGERGLLELLRKAGFEVTPVTEVPAPVTE
ncbi:MAG: TraB/GumN family protein [Bacteroidales bacterium]|nr:TraB/GumN family protein [Bacteroidales bacterium]